MENVNIAECLSYFLYTRAMFVDFAAAISHVIFAIVNSDATAILILGNLMGAPEIATDSNMAAVTATAMNERLIQITRDKVNTPHITGKKT